MVWESYVHSSLQSADKYMTDYMLRSFFIAPPDQWSRAQGHCESALTMFMVTGVLLLDYLLAPHSPYSDHWAIDLTSSQDVVYKGVSPPNAVALATNASTFREWKHSIVVTAEKWDAIISDVQEGSAFGGHPPSWDGELRKAAGISSEGHTVFVRLAGAATQIRSFADWVCQLFHALSDVIFTCSAQNTRRPDVNKLIHEATELPRILTVLVGMSPILVLSNLKIVDSMSPRRIIKVRSPLVCNELASN
jgi:hypothetical protein